MADIVGLPPLEVFAMDEYMNRLTGSIPYTSLQWNRKYYEPGTFEMVVPVTVYDPNWAYIYCDDRPETGIVQKVEYTDSSTVAGGIDTVTVSGFFMEQLLNDYTFLVEETEEQEMKVKKAQPARNKMPELFTDENGKLISVSSWYLHGEQYFDYRDVATGEKLSPEQVSDNRTYIELTPDDGYEAITYPILDANGQEIGEWTAGLYQSSYDYYKDDDNTFHKVDAAGNDTVVDNVVSSWLAQGGGSVIYKDDNGDYRWIGGVVTDINDTYYRQAESWERLVSNTNAEIVYTTDGQYAVYMVEVKGAWQLRTDIGEVGVPTDNVQTIVKWAQRAFGNSLVYDEPKVTGVKKVLEPTFKRMGDMFFEELQTIGASVRLFYSFGANQTVFQIWQGFDRTQGDEWEDEPIEQPKALAARALAAPATASNVPAGFTRLNYIESAGQQYIDTGFKPTGATKIVADMQFTVSGSEMRWSCLFGGRTGATNAMFSLAWTGSAIRSDYGSSTKTFEVSCFYRREYVKDAGSTEIDGDVLEMQSQSFVSSSSLTVFALNDGGTVKWQSKARCWGMDIYDSGSMVMSLVPCSRDSDGAVGMVDTLTGAFYGNSGTGAFVSGGTFESPYAGMDVLPEGYDRLLYVRGDGSSYVNLGFSFSSSDDFKIDLDIPDPGSNTYGVFGNRDTDTSGGFMLYAQGDDGASFMFGSQSVSSINGSVPLIGRHSVAKSGFTISFDSNRTTLPDSVFSTTGDCMLFAFGKSGQALSRSPVAVYSFNVSGSTDVDFSPAKRKSDGTIGFYESNSGMFFANSGSGQLVAGAVIDVFAVSYEGNAPSVSGSTAATRAYYGTEAQIAQCGFSLNGYEFAGWAESSAGSVAYQPGDPVIVTGDMTLYAVWRSAAVPDALNYSANADEYTGATPSTSGNVGDAVIVSQCLFSVPDAEFAAWNTSPSGSGTTYHPGDIYTLTDGDDVLYAQWNYADPEPGENGRKAPFCTFSDTWGSMWGASASRDISNYRNLCYLLYEYDEPNWDDEGHPEVVKDLKSQQWYIPYTSRRSYEIVRLEDDARDQETYLDRRSDKPPGDQDWPRDAQDEKPDVSSVNKSDYDAWFDTMKNDARAMLINDYPIVNNVNTGTLRQTGYLHDFDLGDLVDLAIDAIGMKKTARIIGVDEVYESGNSEIHLEMGEELVTVFKKSQLAQLGG